MFLLKQEECQHNLKMANDFIHDIYLFCKEYFNGVPEETIKKNIALHLYYGTIDIVMVNTKIIAVARWNISPSGQVAHVLDVIIEKGHRSKEFLRFIIKRNLHRFPTIKFLRYARFYKYPKRKEKLVSVDRLI